jgi:large subunit ribosomal protein L37Ae
MKTKKVKAAGRFGAGYGLNSRKKLVEIENKQRKKQTCPFCKKQGVKREAKGIWHCQKCGKRFASDIYYLS